MRHTVLSDEPGALRANGLLIALVLAAATTGRCAEPPSFPDVVPASDRGFDAVIGPLQGGEASEGDRRPLEFGLPSADVAGIRNTMGLLDTGIESLFGPAYEGGQWRPLSLSSLFTEGWNEPWFNGPAGREDLTPRQGWLGSDAGLFYRLWHTNFTYAHQLNTPYHGDQYTGSYHIFLPFSRRFELAVDAPFVTSNGTIDPRRGYTSNFGDLLVVPRFLLSDSKALSQMFALDIRTPTGSPLNGNGLMALTPRYEFWANPVGPWVFRGLGGIGVPLNRPSEVSEIAYVVGIPSNRTSVPNQTTFHGNLALGRYFTPKGTPFGHLVLYATASWRVPLQGNVSTTFVSVGPGFRFEVAEKTYLLGFVEVPLTAPRVVDYLMQFSIMRVF